MDLSFWVLFFWLFSAFCQSNVRLTRTYPSNKGMKECKREKLRQKPGFFSSARNERWIKRAFEPPNTVRKPRNACCYTKVTIYNPRTRLFLACSVPKNTKGPNYSIRNCNGILANETVLDRF